MLSYAQIYSAITAELSSMLLENEELVDDVRAYELTIATFGWQYEPRFAATWQGNRAGAQCFAGELGEAALQYMLQSVPAEMREPAEACAREMRGHIYYYTDALAESVYSVSREWSDAETMRRIHNLVVFVVAHERRHSHQAADMLDIQVENLDDLAAYQAQRHEADADAFANAVVRHEAEISDVATWQAA